MVYFGAGVLLAVIVAVAAHLVKFDQDRSFYPTVLIVIASYYVLFAFMSQQSIVIEMLFAVLFVVIAVFGALYLPVFVGVGIVLHGIFDLLRADFITNSGVPLWWPAFCAGVDIVLGIWVLFAKKFLVINEEN